MVALRLDEAALAHSRGIVSRFGDVRVINEDGRQVPYLVERSSEPLSVEVMLQRLHPVPPELRNQAERVGGTELRGRTSGSRPPGSF